MTSEEIKRGPTAWVVQVRASKRGGAIKAKCYKKQLAAHATDTFNKRVFYDNQLFIKYKYYESAEEAERVCNILNSISITVERKRGSATQGECAVYINGIHIINFGDNIVLVPKSHNKSDYYGEDIGGYMSNKPDGAFAIGIIWHPLEKMIHLNDTICTKLGITPKEWIGG